MPDEVTEEEFWRNYFYEVEKIKKEHGLPSNLGEKLSDAARIEAANKELEDL